MKALRMSFCCNALFYDYAIINYPTSKCLWKNVVLSFYLLNPINFIIQNERWWDWSLVITLFNYGPRYCMYLLYRLMRLVDCNRHMDEEKIMQVLECVSERQCWLPYTTPAAHLIALALPEDLNFFFFFYKGCNTLYGIFPYHEYCE